MLQLKMLDDLHRRQTPEQIDRREERRLAVCPCGGPLQRCNRKRTGIIIDIPADLATGQLPPLPVESVADG